MCKPFVGACMVLADVEFVLVSLFHASCVIVRHGIFYFKMI